MAILITPHARERLKERTGYSPTRASEVVEEIYYCGKTTTDYNGRLRLYLENVLEASSGDELRVKGNDVYLFGERYGNRYLITVLTIPNKIINNQKKHNFNTRSNNERTSNYVWSTR